VVASHVYCSVPASVFCTSFLCMTLQIVDLGECCGPGVGAGPGDPRSGLCGPVGLR